MRKLFNILATLMMVMSSLFYYFGYDVKSNYLNVDSSIIENINAYVGGDAYNYIINANYFTGFIVSATLFFIGALIIFLINNKTKK